MSHDVSNCYRPMFLGTKSSLYAVISAIPFQPCCISSCAVAAVYAVYRPICYILRCFRRAVTKQQTNLGRDIKLRSKSLSGDRWVLT